MCLTPKNPGKSAEVQELLLALSRMLALTEDETVCPDLSWVAASPTVINARQVLAHHHTKGDFHG